MPTYRACVRRALSICPLSDRVFLNGFPLRHRWSNHDPIWPNPQRSRVQVCRSGAGVPCGNLPSELSQCLFADRLAPRSSARSADGIRPRFGYRRCWNDHPPSSTRGKGIWRMLMMVVAWKDSPRGPLPRKCDPAAAGYRGNVVSRKPPSTWTGLGYQQRHDMTLPSQSVTHSPYPDRQMSGKAQGRSDTSCRQTKTTRQFPLPRDETTKPLLPGLEIQSAETWSPCLVMLWSVRLAVWLCGCPAVLQSRSPLTMHA
ncbi:uncharacterized protein PV07_08562 [Cladophialophora immunda]|uniref:Uncharacterized protein n=1 Tax=Cladophialophora immunda TaxID=569365 RepID=A0A0D2CP90_9EURO|nr:uncharacterized protein PV07_08562 [Cladophialophora immunda]KIW25379.1 hypothetical protein PV07_08562 [Cladophialophora immunda]